MSPISITDRVNGFDPLSILNAAQDVPSGRQVSSDADVVPVAPTTATFTISFKLLKTGKHKNPASAEVLRGKNPQLRFSEREANLPFGARGCSVLISRR